MATSSRAHAPVMLAESLHGWLSNADGVYVDATFGRGGHAIAALAQLSSQAKLLVVDRDPQAIAAAQELAAADPRVQVLQSNYADLDEAQVRSGSVDGVLLDLGVSSPQLDQAERGFSFAKDGPLDMRMDPSSGRSAAQWLASHSEAEFAQALKLYGEEPQARAIARELFAARGTLHTTKQLADLVARVKGGGKPGRNPATQVFQALRIAVNQELELLGKGLNAAVRMLKVGGRLAVLSFHSLEDRIVKQFLAEHAKPPAASRRAFMLPDLFVASLALRGKHFPSEAECASNPRARSAVLRLAEKLL